MCSMEPILAEDQCPYRAPLCVENLELPSGGFSVVAELAHGDRGGSPRNIDGSRCSLPPGMVRILALNCQPLKRM